MSKKEMLWTVASALVLLLVCTGQLTWNVVLTFGASENVRSIVGLLAISLPVGFVYVVLGLRSSRWLEYQLNGMTHRAHRLVYSVSLAQMAIAVLSGFTIPNATAIESDQLMRLFQGGALTFTSYSFVSLWQWMDFHRHTRTDHTTTGVRWVYSMAILVLMLADVIIVTKATDQTIFAMATIASAAACTYGVFFYQEKIRWNHPDEVLRFFLFLVGAHGTLQVAFAMSSVMVFPEQSLAPPVIVIMLGTFLTATMGLIAWNTRLVPGWLDPHKNPAGGGMENG